jgi:hypothetical protein
MTPVQRRYPRVIRVRGAVESTIWAPAEGRRLLGADDRADELPGALERLLGLREKDQKVWKACVSTG